MAARPPKKVGPPPPSYTPNVILDSDELAEVIRQYEAFDYIVFDVETIGGREGRGSKKDIPALDERTNEVLWIAIAGPGRVDIIPLGHPGGPTQLDRSEALMALKPLFFSDRAKINQNVLFDTLSLAKYWGAIPPGPYGDTTTLVHLLNENLMSYKLGDLVTHYFQFAYRKLAAEGTPIDQFPFEDVARYVGLDAKLTQLLWASKRPLYDRPGSEKLKAVLNMEQDLIEVLIHAKHRGALVNRDAFTDLDTHLAAQLAITEDKIYASAGRKFLITSTQQRAKLLYGSVEEGNLGLDCKVMTDKGAPSTAEKALKPLVRKHAVVPLLMQHADLSKLKSTYTSGFMPHVADDGRIRCSLNPNGARTGRFSSSKPNLQNIPRQSDDEDAQRIRSMFIAPPGYVLVVGDFGQVEYRAMAHFAGPLVKESRLLQAFLDGIDLHAMTGAGLHGVALEDLGKEQRQNGKTANFCLMFGGGSNRLVESGFAVKRAEAAFDSFHATYPEVNRFTERTVAHCRQMPKPYVETLWGRRRRLPEINLPRNSHEAGRIRSYAERQAVNHIIQGTAADINKSAMVRAYRRLERFGLKGRGHLVLTVHDEIMLEVPEDKAEAGVELLREAMENVKIKLRVPLVADIHYGANWAAAK